MKIYKYPVPVTDINEISMPEGSALLSVQLQGNLPMLWALVSPEAPLTVRTLRTYGTGQPLPDEVGTFVDTYQLDGGRLVFHVFDLGEISGDPS